MTFISPPKRIHFFSPRYLAGETVVKKPHLNPIRHKHNNYPHHLLTNKENGSLQRRLPLSESLPHLHPCKLILAVSANLVTYRSHLPLNDLLHITAKRARELRHPSLFQHPIFLLLSLNSILGIIKKNKRRRRPWRTR